MGMPSETGERWAVIGAGMLGLTLAWRLAQAGRQVTVFEGAPHAGGLADAWGVGGVRWDRFYHVILKSDVHLRGLLAELDLDRRIDWHTTTSALFADGVLHPLAGAADYLRLPLLGPVAKMRLAATILLGALRAAPGPLDHMPVERWLRRLSGDQAFERLWLPLLRSKLGERYTDTAATFIWATIRRLFAARRQGLAQECLGHVPGGYGTIIPVLLGRLQDRGVDIRVGTRIDGVAPVGTALRVQHAGGGSLFDRVAVTTTATSAARLCPALDAAERARLGDVAYQGVICLSLHLRRPLGPHYLTYFADDMPFTAVVDMSALMGADAFGGQGLVYLPRYVAPDDPLFGWTDEQIATVFFAALQRVHRGLAESDLLGWKVARAREVFAIPRPGAAPVPGPATSVPGLFIVNAAQIRDGTLNVNEVVALADRSLPALLSGAPPLTLSAGRAAE